jgi:hypothetical protein
MQLEFPEMNQERKRNIGRWGLLTIIILTIVSFFLLYFSLNEYHVIHRAHSCILDEKKLYSNIKEMPSTNVTHYCIDGYSYIGINHSNDLTAQIIGNHHPYPRKCSCEKLNPIKGIKTINGKQYYIE